ncbi:MAG: DUF4160 domain-containing protein [Bacteroidota bacterium]|nr:DUF4160 domain-containing protein [Bacteroidota bacterium]
MPQICRFFGIIISMFYDEHNPPHFHANYGEYNVEIGICDLAILHGKLPSRVLGFVIEWAAIHQTELLKNWERAENGEMVQPIEPLE